jgi:hypothetical protein
MTECSGEAVGRRSSRRSSRSAAARASSLSQAATTFSRSSLTSACCGSSSPSSFWIPGVVLVHSPIDQLIRQKRRNRHQPRERLQCGARERLDLRCRRLLPLGNAFYARQQVRLGIQELDDPHALESLNPDLLGAVWRANHVPNPRKRAGGVQIRGEWLLGVGLLLGQQHELARATRRLLDSPQRCFPSDCQRKRRQRKDQRLAQGQHRVGSPRRCGSKLAARPVRPDLRHVPRG